MDKTQYPGSLHNHTEYSNFRLRDSINRAPELMSYAEELGHTVIAFTEHETISNWVEIEKEAKKHPNLKVLRGNEIYLVRNGLNADNFVKDVDKYYHFILIAKDLVGARQIMELSTRAWLRSYVSRGRMRRVPTYYQDLIDIVGANPGHVIGSTACLGGALGTQILRGTDDKKLISWLMQLRNIFGEENFYMEMQPSKNKDQIKVNRKIIEFSQQTGIKFIITTDSHYLKASDRSIHKAYLNAQDGEREVDEFYATTYMMDTEELEPYMKYTADDLNLWQRAYYTIQEIADKCEDFSLIKPLKIPELIWRPVIKDSSRNTQLFVDKIPTLQKFVDSPYQSDRYLVDAIIDGIKNHSDLQNEEVYAELEDNLQRTWESSEVSKARWSAYFLNLQNIIDECWNAGTLVGPSRGSGGGFLLLYCLDIIQMNTLRETTKTFPWRLTLRV